MKKPKSEEGRSWSSFWWLGWREPSNPKTNSPIFSPTPHPSPRSPRPPNRADGEYPVYQPRPIKGKKTPEKDAAVRSYEQQVAKFARRTILHLVREMVEQDKEFLTLGAHKLLLEQEELALIEETRKKKLSFHSKLSFYFNYYLVILVLMMLAGGVGVVVGLNLPERVVCRTPHTPCWHLRFREKRFLNPN